MSTTMQAVLGDTVIAESDRTIVVEGNHYFPEESLREDYFSPTSTISVCPWKGKASYFTVSIDGVTHPDTAWTYRKPFPLARKIKNHVAFWGAVEVRPAAGRGSR